MTVFQAICLGFLQGIAEFLPISSSGHLAVVQNLFGLEEVPLLFDVFLHLATLASVVLYFRRKIGRLFCVLGRWITGKKQKEESVIQDDLISGTDENGRKTIIAVLISTFVTAVIGIVTSKLIKDGSISIKITCAGFLVTACLLFVSSRIEKKRIADNSDTEKRPVSKFQALFIGLMQGVGTLPGISRSGSTIAASQLCGVDRACAGEYSFIISIPAILGAFLLELKDLGEVSSSIGACPLIAGCAAAFAWGYLALSFLMKLIRRGKLEWFSLYLIPCGILGMIFLK